MFTRLTTRAHAAFLMLFLPPMFLIYVLLTASKAGWDHVTTGWEGFPDTVDNIYADLWSAFLTGRPA